MLVFVNSPGSLDLFQKASLHSSGLKSLLKLQNKQTRKPGASNMSFEPPCNLVERQ